MDFYGWKPYVPVAERRRKATREIEKRRKKGHTISPVIIEGRTIAKTFWGKSWCENLERYSDYANRLPRGRTYVRNGSVVDLQISPARFAALVSGSEVYTENAIKAGSQAAVESICEDCAGAIDSLVELLQGRFSKGVMERICRQEPGIVPTPCRNQALLQLSRLGGDVQACGCCALWRRRPVRRKSGTAVPPAGRGSRGTGGESGRRIACRKEADKQQACNGRGRSQRTLRRGDGGNRRQHRRFDKSTREEGAGKRKSPRKNAREGGFGCAGVESQLEG